MNAASIKAWLTPELCNEVGYSSSAVVKSENLENGIFKILFTNHLTSKSVLLSIQIPKEADVLPEFSCVDAEFSSQISMYVMDNFENLDFKNLVKKCLMFWGTDANADDEDWGSDDDVEEGSWEDDDIVFNEDDTRDHSMPDHLENEMMERQKYLAYQSKLLRRAEHIRDENTIQAHEEELVKSNIFNPKAVSLMLAKQVIEFRKNYDSGDLSIDCTAIDDNVYNWNVKIRRFDEYSNLHDDMLALNRQHGYNYVELELNFLVDIFPFFPPTVKLIRPRIENFVFARIVTMPELQLSQWNPTSKIADLLTKIKILLETYGRVDSTNPVNNLQNDQPPFTEIEFQLLRLSMLTETPSRCVALESTGRAATAVGVQNLKNKVINDKMDVEGDEKSKAAWAAGTGYGHGGDSTAWDIEAWEKAQLRKNSEVTAVLESVAVELANDTIPEHVVLESCLLPYLHKKCANDSLNDMGLHFSLYQIIFNGVISNMLKHATLQHIFADVIDGMSLEMRLHHLYKKCKMVMQVAKGIEKAPEMATAPEPKSKSSRSHALFNVKRAAGHVTESASKNYAYQLSQMICEIYERYIEIKVNIPEEEVEDISEKRALVPENYVSVMRPLSFGMHDKDFTFHHFIHKKKKNIVLNRKLLKRLASEFSDLPSGLPIDFESSVFFRASEENVSFCQMLIIPCDGTPYGGGCFLFDVCFPSKYPLVAPLVNLQTTGKGTVRFNPNLYNCGKVCLSLLGTWNGANQGEQWNPGLSTIFQVALSIQSLIFVPRPYFNEPGFEATMGTTEGEKRSQQYNTAIQKATVRWAIIDMLENTPAPFAEIIQNHFKMSKKRVMSNCEKWLGKKDPQTLKVKELLDKL